MPAQPMATALFAALALWGCRRADPMLAGVAHSGFRDDVADADRGNAVFEELWWSDDGAYFVTRHHLARGGLRVWETSSGRRIADLDLHTVDGLLPIDGRGKRVVGRVLGALANPSRERLVITSLDGTGELGSIPDDPAHPAVPLGLTAQGASLVLSRPGVIEVWDLRTATRVRELASPIAPTHYEMKAVILFATYHEERCWELSASGRLLALTHYQPASSESPARWRAHLVDLTDASCTELELPDPSAAQSLQGVAISPDEQRIAIGSASGIFLYDVATRAWGPFLRGEHARNPYLGPMRFSSDGTRLVALGDQLAVSVFDTASGACVGRWAPDFGDEEGIFRASADGSRVVVYRFGSDVLQVLDGRDARSIGFVCPYFCNARHNPVPVHYGVTADGARVVASHRYGAAIWETDTDRLLTPLRDPTLPPARPR